MQETQAESIIALDVGTAVTKAALFDVVEGERRLCARGRVPSTLYAPGADVSRGAAGAIQRLEEIVGRPLMAAQGPLFPEQSDGRGVDDCFIVSSVGGLLRVVVVATSGPTLAHLYREAAALPGVDLVAAISLDAKPPAGESHMGHILGTLHERRPHVLVVGEGGEAKNGLVELTQALTIGAQTGGAVPAVVFNGGEENAATIRRSLSDSHKLYCLPPEKASGEGFTLLQEHLRSLWRATWQEEVPGAASLVSWSGTPPAPSQQGFANALRFIAAHEQRDVWGLDIGAGTATAVRVVGGVVATSVHAGLGVGQGGMAFLGDPSALTQWLPFPVHPADGELADALLQKYFHPYVLPETEAELAREGAVARAIAQKVLGGPMGRVRQSPDKPTLLVGTGAVLGEAPSVSHAFLLLLDAFQPVGFVELAVDRLSILPMLGTVAEQYPEAAAELVMREGKRSLGQCIAIGGTSREGSVAVKITLEQARQKVKVPALFGEIKVLPLAEGETGKITLEPAGKLDCGGGSGRKVTRLVRGGPLGLVVDARGRPLVPGQPGEDQSNRLGQWRKALGV